MKYRVIAQRLNVRKSAKKDSEVLRIVERDEILDATSSKNEWVRLKGTGYVMEEYVTPINSNVSE
ncbi:MAG: SH3 domain-containing protein [Bullifex sp.]